MVTVKCSRCNATISDYIYVVNKYGWCQKCFDEFVMPHIKVPIEEYLYPYSISKEIRDSN